MAVFELPNPPPKENPDDLLAVFPKEKELVAGLDVLPKLKPPVPEFVEVLPKENELLVLAAVLFVLPKLKPLVVGLLVGAVAPNENGMVVSESGFRLEVWN